MTEEKKDTVTLTIDGQEVTVPKGTNLIEAAKQIKTEIPHYCYHPHLSVPGNCRMCQVEVVGAPKLMIGCHTQAQDGMEVRTQETSKEVKDAQAATLEFILINHPLDCTVCDQAGHCKLQDYHYEYNAKPSRFIEEKVKKVKAESLGPNVILDGERCIMCTRCIRFCDEVTETGELGMLNRGDKSVISINPGKELNNPLASTVVDLCPVGALTHKNWRFNTRIWYTKETNAICPGCSTGCNTKIAVRDDQVVQVKARLNSKVNKEWMCDEGRYGMERFLPKSRITSSFENKSEINFDDAIKKLSSAFGKSSAIFISPNLLTEEFYLLKQILSASECKAQVVVAYKERELSKEEAVLISPDYAANYKGAQFVGLLGSDIAAQYESAIKDLAAGKFTNLIFIGDNSIDDRDKTVSVFSAINNAESSVAICLDSESGFMDSCNLLIPGKSVLEKSGLLVNKDNFLQYTQSVLDGPKGAKTEWEIFQSLAKSLNIPTTSAQSDRELTNWFFSEQEKLSGSTIKKIKSEGVSL